MFSKTPESLFLRGIDGDKLSGVDTFDRLSFSLFSSSFDGFAGVGEWAPDFLAEV